MWQLLALLPCALALRTLEPPPPAPTARDTAEPLEGYIDVRLHHFDASNTDTFPMRYYYNNNYRNGSDIVIFVGGEWAVSPGWARAGLAQELAEELGAGLFYTEHRYYGLTRPTNTTSVEELRFLNVDQALADLAQFIQVVKSDQFENGRFRDGKVALVGCSYAGSMATWMRLAYPHLVHAVFSDSGPLHAQEDFPEYLEVITEALSAQGGAACLAAVEQSMLQLVALLATVNGPTQVSSMFNTCSVLQAGTPLDVATFFWFGITETFAYLVQYATPGDIPDACAALTDATVPNAVQRLANWVTAQPWTQPCIETRYAEVVAAHSNTSYDSPQAVMRLWTYQTCVEYGWYQTTSSSRQPFLSTVPLEYFHQMCRDFFSTDFSEQRLRAGIERTNLLFAGLTHLPDNTVSVAGGHDPWSPMGPNSTHATARAHVHVVPQVSHCRAIQSTVSSDTEELAAVKRAVLSRMHELITGEPLQVAHAPRLAASALLAVGALFALAAGANL